MNNRFTEQENQKDDLRKFKTRSFILGVLAFLPFGFIILISWLNTFGYYPDFLVFVGICPAGAIGLVVIAYAEVKLVWKYLGGKEDERKLTIICMAISLLSFVVAFFFIIITWAYTIWAYRS